VDPGILFYEVDTVTVRNPLSFTQISEMLSIPREEIEFLNPSFKLDFIPATTENTYQLRLRKKDVGNFINNEKALYAFRPKNWTGKDSLMVFNYREADLYTVKSGETLAGIAKKFNMTVTEIKTLNGLKKNYVKTRQKLLVYTTPSKERQARAVNTPADPGGVSKTGDTLSPNQSKQSISQDDLSVSPQKITSQPSSVHVVKSGESLGSIAMRYHCSVNELVAWNNLRDSKILIGQKLKVTRPAAFSPTSSTSKPDALSRQISSGNGSTQAFFYYTIVSGDNLWDIADKFNVTVSQIKNLNDLKNSSRIRPGQKIKIPR
jgi:membrane-bound lytic murein transglycosylase D